MELGLPRYPVDFLRLTVIFELIGRQYAGYEGFITDIVRENPFGTAFDSSAKHKTNVRAL